MTLEQAIQAKDEFISNAMNPDSVVSEFVRMAVKRHESDLKEVVENPDFLYYFDDEASKHVLSVFCNFKFAQGKWARSKFELHGWQAFVLWVAYGWKRKDNNWRRFEKVYIKVPRKNGKTEFMAGIGMYGQSFDRYDQDRQVFWFATKKDQAAIGFKKQKSMASLLMLDSPTYASKVKITQYRISDRESAGFTVYLGKDSKTEDGHDPFYGLCDEYHAHPNNDMLDVIESGMGARDSPMIWIITTAGTNPEGPCATFERTCKQILRGVIQNDAVLPLIFDLSENDDWEDERNWAKVNPSLGVSPKIEYLRSQYQKAKTQGITARNNFLTKNLNVWVKSLNQWMLDDVWMKHAAPIITDELNGRLCFGGLDLATTSDIAALILEFPPENEGEKTQILCRFWCPEDSAMKRSKLDGVPYLQWANDGYLTLTPGNVTDYNFIKKEILELAEKYYLHSVGYDPYNSSQLVIDLMEEGLLFEKFSQRAVVMSAPINDMERLILTGEYNNGLNPVLRWMCSNTVTETSAEGNIRFDKKRSTEKIDGMVAAAMAHGQRMNNNDIVSSYGKSVFIRL